MDMPGGGISGHELEWKEAIALCETTWRQHNKPVSGLALGPSEMKDALGRGEVSW